METIDSKSEKYWEEYDLAEEEQQDQIWEEHYKYWEKADKEFEIKEEMERIERIRERKWRERLWDFSGDDSSLDDRFW